MVSDRSSASIISPLAQNYRALDHIAQLAQISRPAYWRIAANASGEKPCIIFPA